MPRAQRGLEGAGAARGAAPQASCARAEQEAKPGALLLPWQWLVGLAARLWHPVLAGAWVSSLPWAPASPSRACLGRAGVLGRATKAHLVLAPCRGVQ